MNDKTVLVTGANGFLGKTILSQLKRARFATSATDIGNASATAGIAYQKSDITRPEKLMDAIGGAATIIHAAGVAHIFSPSAGSDKKFHLINEIGTENVTKVAARAGVEHLILISSVSVYGPYTLGLYDENTPCHPVGPYPMSKFHAELKAMDIAEKSGMALTILRLATLYGEGDPGNVGRLIRALDQRRFVWIGDGTNRKSLLYKEDAAKACVTVASSPAAGTHIYNVSAPPCTMHEIVDGIADALGKRQLPLRIPSSLALVLSRNLAKLPNRRLVGIHQTVQKWMVEDMYDTSRFERDYGFCSQVGVREGLRREVDWYRDDRKSLTP
jgi:nucleoside-diphosphate-sugar epimerase